MTTLTDQLLASAAAVIGVPVGELRARCEFGEARTCLDNAESTAQLGDPQHTAAWIDRTIQELVTLRHRIAPGPVRRVLPELDEGHVLMDNGQRWNGQEWRRSTRDPDMYVDQDGAQCPPRCLPASLVVVPATTNITD